MDLSGQHDWSEYTLYWAEACVDEGHTVICTVISWRSRYGCSL
jgi:hypothetical protein